MTAESRDNWGDRWRVYEHRDTKHGFEVLLGRPEGTGVPLNRTGGNRVILTRELVEYMTALRIHRGEVELPLGAGAIKRVRRLLGFNLYDDLREWWEGHADELIAMTETAFAARHGKTVSLVCRMNRKLFGKRLRQPGWHLKEPARSLLAGASPRAYVAEKLGISVGSVGRLRWALRHKK